MYIYIYIYMFVYYIYYIYNIYIIYMFVYYIIYIYILYIYTYMINGDLESRWWFEDWSMFDMFVFHRTGMMIPGDQYFDVGGLFQHQSLNCWMFGLKKWRILYSKFGSILGRGTFKRIIGFSNGLEKLHSYVMYIKWTSTALWKPVWYGSFTLLLRGRKVQKSSWMGTRPTMCASVGFEP